MDYEKKYNEAMLRADEAVQKGCLDKGMFDIIFPPDESEDERMVRVIGLALTDVPEERFTSLGTTLNGCLSYLKKQKEQKPVERSLEDDHIIGFVYDLLNEIEWKDNWAMSKEECLRLLNNYSPQKPAEWSEDDENVYKTIMDDFNGITQMSKAYKLKAADFLKSLRPQPHWKPSEEQIDALNYAYCELFKRKDVEHNILGPPQKLCDELKKQM